MHKFPSIDVIIPTLNEEKNLRNCLEAILRQDYYKERLKVTIVDGGSTDSTIEIAKKYGCRILINEEKLAEPGVFKGINNSDSDLCCILAVDNIIANEHDFFKNLVKPFLEQDVIGSFPLVICDKKEPSINKYINNRAEPFSGFIYMNACNTQTFNLVFPVLFKNDNYTVFDFCKGTPPLLALAQGFTIERDGFHRTIKSKYDDLLPVMELIKSGKKIAYVEKSKIYHYQIMNIKSFIKKFRWRIRRNLIAEPQKKKSEFFSWQMNIRRKLWAFYSISLILPLFYSIFWCYKKKKLFYFYHFICNTLLFFLIIQEYIKWKFHTLSGFVEVRTYK